MFVRVQVVVVLVSSLYTVKAFSFEVVCIYAQNYDVNWCCTTHVRTPTIYPTYLSRVNGTSHVLLLCIYNNVKYLSRVNGTRAIDSSQTLCAYVKYCK